MKKRFIPAFFLFVYSAILIKVMVFKDVPTVKIGSLLINFSGTDGGHPANFVPFKTILPYVLGEGGPIIAGANLMGNILPLVPVGVLLAWLCRDITWKKALVAAVGAGLLIEIIQAVLHVGIFDIDDVILNALGAMIGYGVFGTVAKWVRARNYKLMIISAAVVMSAVAAMVYAIYPQEQVVAPKGGDLCGGTNGTGQIVSSEPNIIRIRRNDDTYQTISLTARTVIKNSTGSISQTSLKVGDRVTLVVDDTETAATVLVCEASARR